MSFSEDAGHARASFRMQPQGGTNNSLSRSSSQAAGAERDPDYVIA